MLISANILARLGLVAGLTLATAGAASAMPLSASPLVATPLSAAPVAATPAAGAVDQAQIIEVAGGCGFGEHRGPYGGCRLNNGPRGAIRAFETGAPRGCPPRMIRGPFGRCHY